MNVMYINFKNPFKLAKKLMTDVCAGKLSGIRRESVNYVGYYSAHEETMKTVIQSQVGFFPLPLHVE